MNLDYEFEQPLFSAIRLGYVVETNWMAATQARSATYLELWFETSL